MLKSFFKYALLIIGILILVVLTKTFLTKSRQVQVETVPSAPVDSNATKHLVTAIQIPTISYDQENEIDRNAFLKFIAFVKNTYPNIAGILNFQIINQYSLLIEWNGKNDSLKPIILMGHYDVVPIEEASSKQWEYPAFSGTIHNGYIHGRGTLDDKVAVISILESVERLLKKGFVPDRSIIMAFGHDEELGGNNGAKMIASNLRNRKINALLSF